VIDLPLRRWLRKDRKGLLHSKMTSTENCERLRETLLSTWELIKNHKPRMMYPQYSFQEKEKGDS
jgi:hypothetical protein